MTVILEARTPSGYATLELWEHRYSDGRTQLYGKLLSGQPPERFRLSHGNTLAALVIDLATKEIFSDGAYCFLGTHRG